jgi:hypothetical protein
MDFDCWDWTATQDNTPGPDEWATLTVSSVCGKFPTDGYRLELKQHRIGINPMELGFDLIVNAPDSGPEVLSDERVHHEMKVRRDSQHTKVTIYHDDVARWSFPVETVS